MKVEFTGKSIELIKVNDLSGAVQREIGESYGVPTINKSSNGMFMVHLLLLNLMRDP